MPPPIVASTLILLAALSIVSNSEAVAYQDNAEQSVQLLEKDPDAYAIYSVLLPAENPPVKSWNIGNETERGPLPMCITPPSDQESSYRPVIEQFEMLNQRRFLLKRSFDLIAYNLVSRADKV